MVKVPRPGPRRVAVSGTTLLLPSLSTLSSVTQSYEAHMGIAADTEGEGEEDEEVAESPDDASDDQRIIIKKEGRDSNARRY